MVSNRMLWGILKVMILFFFALTALGAIGVFVVLPAIIQGETVEVPNVQGLSLWEARNKLARLGLSFELIGRRYDPSVPPNHVIDQSPPASVNIRRDRPVKLTLSLGAEMVEVPDLTFKHLKEVEPILQSVGLALGQVAHVYDDEAPIPGTVLAQTPLPKGQAKRGQAVHLLVSDGVQPKLLVLPDLRRRSLGEVQRLLRQNGLVPDVTYQADAPLPAGQIVQHLPGPQHYVRVGQTVHLVVSGAAGGIPSERRSISVRHQVSREEGMHHVRIVIVDDRGSRTLVDANYPPGSLVSKPAVVTGAARVFIYEDDMESPVREEER